jgi:hypothetical protein
MYFAKLKDSIVENVVASDQKFIDRGALGDPSAYVLTDFYTRGNIHYDAENKPDGLPPFRGNFAQIGYTYDTENDVFYSPQPYASWSLDRSTWLWVSPSVIPKDEYLYLWDESLLSWLRLESETKITT